MTMTRDEAAAYWARPIGVRVYSRFFSGTFMFHTVGEALAYVRDQWQYAKETACRHPEYSGIEADFHCEFTAFPSTIPVHLFDLDALKRE